MERRVISIAACPRCGGKPTLLVDRYKDRAYVAVRCFADNCGVHTDFYEEPIAKIVSAWNAGIALKRGDGANYYVDEGKPRELISLEVEV